MGKKIDGRTVDASSPEIDYSAMGKRVKLLRKQLSMTQADLAKRMGLSTSFTGHIERGTRIPSLETILRISKALDVTVDDLLTGHPTTAGNHDNSTHKMRMLNDIMRVLNTYSDEWLRNDLKK